MQACCHCCVCWLCTKNTVNRTTKHTRTNKQQTTKSIHIVVACFECTTVWCCEILNIHMFTQHQTQYKRQNTQTQQTHHIDFEFVDELAGRGVIVVRVANQRHCCTILRFDRIVTQQRICTHATHTKTRDTHVSEKRK